MDHGPAHILLVEDDDALRRELQDALRGAGLAITPAPTIAEADRLLRGDKFSLILLDLWLPDGDGLDFCRQLRFECNSIPVIILTARSQPDEVVRGLDVGADDYVTKPFRLPEILARIRSLLRRARPEADRTALAAGPIAVNTLTRRVTRDREEVSLKPREFDLLSFLIRHPGRAWTRTQLLEKVWGPLFDGDDRTVDLHVARLRSALEENPRDPQWIETVWRVGYRFREDAP